MNKFTFIAMLCVAALVAGGCPSPAPKAPESDARKTVKLQPVEDEGMLLGEIEKDFSNADLHYRLGRVYQQKGQIASAEFEYERALVFDPLEFDAQAALVKMWEDTGNTAKADSEIDKYIDRAGNAKNLIGLGMAFHRQGMLEPARRCYERAIQRDPANAVAYKQLGLYYLSKNDKTNASQMFAKSFELDPYQSDVAMELGRLGVTVKARVAPIPAAQSAPKSAPKPTKQAPPAP
jgi:tetratricopeptide (TPR) repeat protein